MGRLGASSKKDQEKCTIACLYGSHGTLTLLGSPVGPFVGSSQRRQITLHVETSNMSDRDAREKNVCAIEMHMNHFCTMCKPVWCPNHPYLNRDACASLMVMHNDQTTYQTIHFKHNNSITWAKTVLGNNSNQMQPTDRTIWLLSNSTLLVLKPATLKSCNPEKRNIGKINH